MTRGFVVVVALGLAGCGAGAGVDLADLKVRDLFPLTSSPDGSAWDVAVSGDEVWVRDSYGAAHFRVEGGTAVELGRVDVTPRSPQGTSSVATNGALVAVGHGQRAVIFDAQTGAQLSALDSLSTGVGQLAFDGTTLYAAMLEAGVRRFDLSQPTAPGGFETLFPRHAQTLLLEGGKLYVSGNEGFFILEAATAKLLGEVRLPLQGAFVLHQGRWLYGNTGEPGVSVLDVADPAAPKVLVPGGSTRFTKGAVALRGGRVLVPSRLGPTLEYGLAEPSSPELLQEVTLVRAAAASNWDLVVHGELLLLAHQTGFVVLGPK